MEITLNSPKYAEAQSLQYQMYKKQKDRKKRKNFVPELFERYYRRNEATTDYATIPEVTLAGDFVIDFDFTADNSRNNKMIGTDNAAKAGLVGIDSSGDVVIRRGGDWVVLGNFALVNGSLYHFKLERNGVNVSAYINGTLIGAAQFGGDWFVGQLYRAFGSVSYEYLSGILANLKIYDNGTLIRDYPLDDNSDILRNRATVLGGELWNGTASFQTGTTTVVASNIPLGIDYLVSVSGLSAGENFNIYAEGGYKALQNNVPLVVRSTDAAFSGEFRCVDFAENQDGVTISIRRADGYGTVINGNASDWGLFQQQATGEWLGENRWHDVDVSFFGLQEQSIIYGDGSYKIATNDGTGTGVQDDTVDSRMVVGTYRISYNVTESLAGFLNFSDFTGPIDSTVGLKSLDVNATSARNLYFKRGTGVGATDITFNGVSVKEVLNVS